jgi:hypothetical protein
MPSVVRGCSRILWPGSAYEVEYCLLRGRLHVYESMYELLFDPMPDLLPKCFGFLFFSIHPKQPFVNTFQKKMDPKFDCNPPLAANRMENRTCRWPLKSKLYKQPHLLRKSQTCLYIFIHGPLKLRTVHSGDITISYESKVSEENIFPWLKGTIESRPHTKFQINCSFK